MKKIKIITRGAGINLEEFEVKVNENLHTLQIEGGEILEIKEIYREGKINAFIIVYKK